MKKTLFIVLLTISTLPSAFAFCNPGSLETDGDKQCSFANQCVDWCKKNVKENVGPALCNTYYASYYSNFMAGLLNRQLRSDKLSEECKKTVNGLAQFLHDSPNSLSNYVYRGIRGINPLSTLNVGDCFTDKAFFSTSQSEKIALKFSDHNGVLLEIAHFSGKEIPSLLKNEKEILLRPNRLLLIQGIYEKKVKKKWADKRYILEEIENRKRCNNYNH